MEGEQKYFEVANKVIEDERAAKAALEEAMRPVEEGGANEEIQRELYDKYLVANEVLASFASPSPVIRHIQTFEEYKSGF